MTKMVTADKIKELFDYEPETGALFHKAGRTNGSRRVGNIQRCKRWVSIHRQKYPATHVVWAMHRGEWPTTSLKHANGDRCDDRIENLRTTKEVLTADRLRQLFRYEPDTGNFIRLISVNHFSAGEVAGSLTSYGYVEIAVDCVRCAAHRLAWLYVYGMMPEKGRDIDHINGNRDDNRIVNLRLATRSDNSKNSRRPCNNTSGVKGVHWNKGCKRWIASIKRGGKKLHIGAYKTLEEAAMARQKTAEAVDGQFVRHE